MPIGLLALTRAAWMLVLALLSLIAAVTLLAAGIDAALADGERALETLSSASPQPIVRSERREAAARRRAEERRAAQVIRANGWNQLMGLIRYGRTVEAAILVGAGVAVPISTLLYRFGAAGGVEPERRKRRVACWTVMPVGWMNL